MKNKLYCGALFINLQQKSQAKLDFNANLSLFIYTRHQ